MGFIRSVLSFARDVLELTRRPPVPLGLTDAPSAPIAEPTPAAPAPDPAPVAERPAPERPPLPGRAVTTKVPAVFDHDFWRRQPLGFLPDGMLGRLIERSRDQVVYARSVLDVKAGNFGASVFPRDEQAWVPWVRAWGRAAVREWLLRYGTEDLLRAFDRHVRMLAAQQLAREVGATTQLRRERANEALAARSQLGHLAPRIPSRPEKD